MNITKLILMMKIRNINLEKIRLENEIIIDKIKDFDEAINISKHEVQKFLLIFHTLMETVNSEEGLQQTDRIITNAILQIVLKIGDLLKKNIDSLNLPTQY